MTLHRGDLRRYYPRADEHIREALAADVAFDHLLALMAQHQLFDVCDLVFKGGTALRKYRFGAGGRLSTDLDFDGAPGADAVIAEEIDGRSLSGFEFSISERRGFYTVHVRTPFDIEAATKMDFSTRGLWLDPETVAPLPVPIHDRYDIALPSIPVVSVDENIAEKLSRWQNDPLVRDLHDLAHARRLIDSPELVTRMWVLKSHQSMTQPRTRHPQGKPAAVVEDLFKHHPASIFDLQDLIYPQQVPDIHKTDLIQRWLNQLPQQYDFCRAALEPPLNELAADVGHLAWRIPQEIDDIQATTRSQQQPESGLLDL